MLVFSRSYSRVWYMAKIAEYAKTGLALLAGLGVACGLRLVFDEGAARETGGQILYYLVLSSIAFPGIVGGRAVMRIMQDLVQKPRGSLLAARGVPVERAVIWGGGHETALFLSKVAFELERKPALHILGIFSGDMAIRGHFVHGIKVIGGLAALRAFVGVQAGLDTLYVTGTVPDDLLASLRQQAALAGMRVVVWRMQEDELHD